MKNIGNAERVHYGYCPRLGTLLSSIAIQLCKQSSLQKEYSAMGSVSESECPKYSRISDFYTGKCILVTGATGFVGKVIVEKLLRSCPHIVSIYLLIRPKENMDAKERLEELIHSKIFDQLRATSPEVFDKLHPVQGDISQPGLGLSEDDTEKLICNVNVVFHSAATVSFCEPLNIALQVNVLGTKRVIDLCQKMVHLEAVIHNSTAYSNCDQRVVKEKLYPSPIEPNGTHLMELLEYLDDESWDYLTPWIIGHWPNTYTYSKAVGEHVILNEAGDLPIAIVRPSIVGAAWREPIPGWVDNKHSLTDLIVSVGEGFLRTYYLNGNMIVDIVPVDITANLMIVSAWYTATHKNSGIAVYNSVSGTERPINWDVLRAHGLASLVTKAVMDDVVWYPEINVTYSKFINKMAAFLKHICPAYAIDVLSRLTGKIPIAVGAVNSINMGGEQSQYFITNEWTFSNDNVQDLHTKLSSTDQKTFNLSLAELNWDSYIDLYCQGTNHFVLEKESSSLPKAKEELSSSSQPQEHLDKIWWECDHQMFQISCALCGLFAIIGSFCALLIVLLLVGEELMWLIWKIWQMVFVLMGLFSMSIFYTALLVGCKVMWCIRQIWQTACVFMVLFFIISSFYDDLTD